EHMALNAIANRNGISVQYLEQVFAALRRADIVKSIKGPQGGYLLKKPASQITVAEIVLALDGSYCVDDELAGPGCEIAGITETVQEKVIDPVNRALDEVLEGVTLADLEEHYNQFQGGAQDMYYI
ncbi:MAG: Rrf2 family transcriptional regulator, partial [Lachnospiraceae bacterium]|nr:Rrf2 family transcriptional regulator [Lachnospiraceae bacterium]